MLLLDLNRFSKLPLQEAVSPRPRLLRHQLHHSPTIVSGRCMYYTYTRLSSGFEPLWKGPLSLACPCPASSPCLSLTFSLLGLPASMHTRVTAQPPSKPHWPATSSSLSSAACHCAVPTSASWPWYCRGLLSFPPSNDSPPFLWVFSKCTTSGTQSPHIAT